MIKTGQPIQTTGNNLVGLWRPSFVKVDHRLFVYGGGGNVTNDLHVLNLCDMRWETIQTTKGIPPCKRYGHTATLWKHYIVVFGGCNESQNYCNDVHLFDLEKLTWFQPEIKGSVQARYLHSAAIYNDKLFIYGGFAKKQDCTYVLDEIAVLDLNTFSWSIHKGVPPRYNHSATLVGHKMYIYAGKEERGNTVSDLFVVNLNTPPYTPHPVLVGSQANNNSQMVLLKSQHFCEAICGKLLVFGKYINNHHQQQRMTVAGDSINNNTPDSVYGLWMLDLDTLEWERQECNVNFETGGWNFFTVITENIRPNGTSSNDIQSQVSHNNLFFLGNTDPIRPNGYDHFRDALIINGETLGLYDIPPISCSNEFGQLLNNPELSDFVIVPANGQELHVHQVILITKWPHFRHMYRSGMTESQQRRMEISEPYEVVLAFLKYLYSDQLDEEEPWQVICDVLVMANMYLLNRFKKVCCQRLYTRHLNIDTCCYIFEKAIMAEESGLKLLALDFMFQHYGAILKLDLLHQISGFARQEFYKCIPYEASLLTNQSRFQIMKNTCALTTSIASVSASLSPTSSFSTNTADMKMIESDNISSSSSSSSSSSTDSLSSSTDSLPSSTTSEISTPLSTSPLYTQPITQLTSYSIPNLTSTMMNHHRSTLINHMRSSTGNATNVQTNGLFSNNNSHQRIPSNTSEMTVGV